MIQENPEICLWNWYEKTLQPAYDSHIHNNVLAVMGDDFTWTKASYSFEFTKTLIEKMNEMSE